jgi:hypothetical protein
MKNPFRSALVLALLAGCFALTATAQKPALVRNDAEPGRTPYQQTYYLTQNNSNCETAQYCRIAFPEVPLGFRLVVTHVSATFNLAPGGTGAYVSLQGGGLSPGDVAFLAASPVTPTMYLVSAPVTYFVNSGNAPVLLAQANNVDRTGYGFEATVTGYLVSIP